MQFFRRYIGHIAALLFLAGLCFYIATNQQIIDSLLSVSAGYVAIIMGLYVLQIVVNGIFTKVMMDAFAKPISHKESVYVSLLSTIGNYFGPLLGGAGIRGAYLKKKHDLSISHFVGILYGYYLITFFASALVGLLGIWVIYSRDGIFSPYATAILAGVLGLTGALFFVRVKQRASIEKKKFVGVIYKKLLVIQEGWSTLNQNRKTLAKLVALGFSGLFIGILTAYVEFAALDLRLSLASVVVYTSIGVMSTLVSFTPGAIGIRETLHLFVANVILLESDEIVQLAALDRAATIVVLLAGFVLLHYVVPPKTSKEKV